MIPKIHHISAKDGKLTIIMDDWLAANTIVVIKADNMRVEGYSSCQIGEKA